MRWNWPNKLTYKGNGDRPMTAAFRSFGSGDGNRHGLTHCGQIPFA